MNANDFRNQYKKVMTLRKKGLTNIAIASQIERSCVRVSQIIRAELEREKRVIDARLKDVHHPYQMENRVKNLSNFIVDNYIDRDADELLTYLQSRARKTVVCDFRHKYDCYDHAEATIRNASDLITRYPRKRKK